MANLCLFDDANKFVFQRGGLHLILKVFQCAVKLQLAFVNDGEVVAEQADFSHAVRGKDDGFSRVSTIADEVYDIARGDDIETVGGFVEYNDIGIVYDRAYNGDFLFHARGEFANAAICKGFHVEEGKEVVAPRVVIGTVHAVQVGKVAHHFIGGQAIVQARVAGKKAEVFAYGLTLCYRVVFRDRYAARSGFEHGGNHAQCGGFSRAIGTQ